MTPADLLVRQQASSAEQAFRSWAQQITRLTRLDDAVRAAAHAPSPGSLVRSMPVLWRSAKHQAETSVERHLAGLVAAADSQALVRALRGLQGYWPRLYVQAQDRIRLLHQAGA